MTILLGGVCSADVTTNTTYLMTDWMKGTTQPASVIIPFHNTDNVSKTITFSKSGIDSDYFDVVPNSIIINANSNNQILLIYSISSGASAGMHQGYLTGNFLPSGVIPIIMNVKEDNSTTTNTYETPCRIIARPSGLYKSIYKDATPTPEEIEVRLTSGCIGGVDLSVDLSGDVIDTSQGRQPVRIKRETLGYLEYGTIGNFILDFDISEVDSRTYNVKAKISGMYEDNIISTDVPVVITALAPGAPFISNSSSAVEPDVIVPEQVQAGTSFQIEIKNLNPNLYSDIIIPDEVSPIGSDISGGRLTYTLMANEPGQIIILIKTRDKSTNLQMFPTERYIIKVLSGDQMQKGSYLTFMFYPSLDNAHDGTEISIQTRDNLTNNIVPAIIYINGLVVEDAKLKLVGGETYFISAVATGYNTLDTTFTTKENALKIIVVPSSPELYEPITIVVKDNHTNEDVNATIKLDGVVLNSHNTQLRITGEHTITAEKSGYTSATLTINTAQNAMLTYAPTALKINQTATFSFSKDTTPRVIFKESPNSTGQIVPTTKVQENQYSIIPRASGFYSIYIKDNKVREYLIEKPPEEGMNFDFKWIPIIIAAIIAVIVILKNKSMFQRKRTAGYPADSGVVTED
jgi:hypothetical protein